MADNPYLQFAPTPASANEPSTPAASKSEVKPVNPYTQFATPAPKADDGYWKGVARAIGQGVSFGFGDEIEARLRSLSSGDREMELARIRDEMEAFKKANPKTAIAAELAGGLAVPGLGAGKFIAGAATTGGKMLRSGIAVAGTGAVSGAGHNEDPDNLAKDIGVGAAIGAGVGSAVPVATSIGAKVLDKVMPSRRAANELAGGVQRDAQAAGTTTAEEMTRIRAAASGPHDALGGNTTLASSLGEETRAAAVSGMRGSATARGQVQRAADEVNAARPGDEAYKAIYAQPHIDGTEAQQIAALIASRPALRQAGALARRNLADSGTPMAPNGQYSHQFMDQLDRVLTDRVSSATREGNGNAATIVGGVRDELRDLLRSASPDLMKIKSDYARGSQIGRDIEGVVPSRLASHEGGASLGDAVSVGGSLVRGNLGVAAAKVMSLAKGVDEAKAQQIADVILTRFGDPERLHNVLAQIERAAPEGRRKVFDMLLTVPATEAVVGDRTVR